jgi:TM2 domain-containing membrane protein YozV
MTSLCSKCGMALAPTTTLCPKCGTDASNAFCIHDSGLFKTLNGYNYMPTLVLCMIAGIFGLHRFYVGKNGSGLIMLLLTVTVALSWVSIIWAIVDLLGMVDGSFFLKLPARGLVVQSKKESII